MRLLTSKLGVVAGSLAAIVLIAGTTGWYAVTHSVRAATAAYNEGRWSAAVQIGLSHLEKSPQSTQARLVVARSYMQMGRWEEAERHFSQVDKVGRPDIEARAFVLMQLSRFHEAADLYQSLYEEHPDDPQCIQQWAASLIPLNKFDQAIQLGERLAEFPSHMRASDFLLATAYHQKFEYATAVKYFERLLENDPELSDVLTQRMMFWEDFGTALFRLGRLDEAQQHLERAVVLHHRPEILDLLAQVHEARRNARRAEQYWLEAITLDPSYLPALKALARLALQQNRPDKSVEYLTNALEFAPNDIAIHTNLAAAYGRAGRSVKAAVHSNWADQLRQLQNIREQLAGQIRGNPDAAEARLLAAMRDIEERRLDDAEASLRKLLRQYPDFVPAQRLLDAVTALQ